MTKILIASGPAVRRVTVAEFIAMWRSEILRPRTAIANIESVLSIADDSDLSAAREAIAYLQSV